MSLLSPSEAIAFNGFLSSVDYGDVLSPEWSSLSTQLVPPRGKEALAKATKDLMSLDPQLDHQPSTSTADAESHLLSSPHPSSSSSKMQTASTSMDAWPNFAPPSVDATNHHNSLYHRYTYGFNIPASQLRAAAAAAASVSSTPPPQRLHNPYNIYDAPGHLQGATSLHSPSQLPLPYPHAHSESSLRHRPSLLSAYPQSPTSSLAHANSFILPPLPDHAQQQQQLHSPLAYSPHHTQLGGSVDSLQRPHSLTTASSAPSVLLLRSSSGSKRALPTDNDSDTSSREGNGASKRQRRPSTTPSLDPTSPTSQYQQQQQQQFTRDVSEAPSQQSGNGGQSQRQALLSPSQKRANHIQSEQKRRANIRRGYEALCEVVPTLREAIRAEEESLAAAEEEKASTAKSRGVGGRKKGKGKGKATGDDGFSSGNGGGGPLDGRAGPRSENVVLSQTIDHLQNLLSERQSLLHRLTFARSTLSAQNPTHPALRTSPEHLVVLPSSESSTSPSSENPNGGGMMRAFEVGIAMWEREWNGGTGLGGDVEDGEE